MSDGQAGLHNMGSSLCQVGLDDRGGGGDSDDDDDFDDVGVGDDNEVGIMMYCGKAMPKPC